MTSRDIPRHRLINQQIALARSKEPAELMTSLGAMQAQDYLGTLWAIGLRLPDATEHSVERAIADRTIVRSWPLRGTLHFVVGTWKRIIKRESVVVMPAPFGSLTQVESRAMSAAIERYRKFLGLRLETEAPTRPDDG